MVSRETIRKSWKSWKPYPILRYAIASLSACGRRRLAPRCYRPGVRLRVCAFAKPSKTAQNASEAVTHDWTAPRHSLPFGYGFEGSTASKQPPARHCRTRFPYRVPAFGLLRPPTPRSSVLSPVLVGSLCPSQVSTSVSLPADFSPACRHDFPPAPYSRRGGNHGGWPFDDFHGFPGSHPEVMEIMHRAGLSVACVPTPRVVLSWPIPVRNKSAGSSL